MSVINVETWTCQTYHCFAWKVMSQMKLKEDGRMRSRDSDPWWNVAAWHLWHRQAYRSTFSAHSATTLERAGTDFVNDFGWVMGHVGSMNCISLNLLNDFFENVSWLVNSCNLFEVFHPRAGRSGHLGQPSPLRPAAFRIAGMAHALFGASPLCRRTHAHKAGRQDLMKYDGDEIVGKVMREDA